ncbi:predicted protein [Plenodomus lingam JN3]|uniref:Predicted protein n=1 Tax=Leptosphaeria maculans (strain JN3 / isolate v23.1.3 / race Av1-4-5-6-7-8) TaxID=985895 RepID=E4ZN45_LEPMJ|nr:predicted protein [Plenodomus lingam JN3]CBX92648.1 predicted protein [Plenodomus lingam JN3]
MMQWLLRSAIESLLVVKQEIACTSANVLMGEYDNTVHGQECLINRSDISQPIGPGLFQSSNEH